MNIADGFRWLIGRENSAPLQTRETIDDLITRFQVTQTNPWTRQTIAQAQSVPAVFRAVSLISNTTGSLSLEAYRNGGKLPDDDTPIIVKRPNPFTTPQVFWRDSSSYMASSGETWWWTAKRDIDDVPLSLIQVDPRQIIVTANPKDALRPIIEWTDPNVGRSVRMPNRDMTQVMLQRDPNNPLRGWGPLQACGAAVSVAVEAQNWAANFFAESGIPSVVVKTTIPMTEEEAGTFKTQWASVPNNQPRIVDPTVDTVTDFQVDAQSAQLTESREFQDGQVALMFGIPGVLMEHQTSGSSLTYQNLADVWTQFTRGCLIPNYLEPMEQAFSDLLTRRTIARFSVAGLQRADVKTRYEVYGIGIDKGIFPPEYAAQQEGILPGDVENRPIPFAAPQAVPDSLPVQTRTRGEQVRCTGMRIVKGGSRNGQLAECGKLLAESGPFVGTCDRCKKVYKPVAAPGLRIVKTDYGAFVEETA